MLSTFIRIICCIVAFAFGWTCAQIVMARIRVMPLARNTPELEDVLRDPVLCFAVFAAAGAVVSAMFSLWLLVPCTIVAFVLSRRAPAALDKHKKRALRSACDEDLDVMSDIVAMGVRAGLSFDSSIDMYCEKFDCSLAREMQVARMQWKSGITSRQQALEDLACRIGSKAIRRFAETSLQAIHYGSPLAEMLARFSRDIRQRRKSAIERQIEKAPVRLLIPTGTCILPAMLVLVMGPVLLQFVGQGF